MISPAFQVERKIIGRADQRNNRYSYETPSIRKNTGSTSRRPSHRV